MSQSVLQVGIRLLQYHVQINTIWSKAELSLFFCNSQRIYLALSVIDRIIALSPSVAPAASVGEDATAADTISRGPACTGEVTAFDTEKQ